MDFLQLSTIFLIIIGIVLFSQKIQDKFKVPMPHTLILLSFVVQGYFSDLYQLNASSYFDTFLMLMIPLILMNDALHLKFKDIKAHSFSIFYLAVIAVTISVLLGTTLFFFDVITGASFAVYVAVLAMLMATDAISVSNILSNFKISHHIKVLTEGESLGNDATAIIIFHFIALPWVINGFMDFSTIPLIALKVFGLSVVVGIGVGFLGYFIIKQFHDYKSELLITISVSYSAFVLAENLNVSGIFALIVAVITFKTLVDFDLKHFESKEKKDKLNLPLSSRIRAFSKVATTKENHNMVLSQIESFGYLAVLILFVSLTDIINPEKMITYWKEILIFFGATTIIRALVMAKFAYLSHKTSLFEPVSFKGWVILTLAGIKGGISIIMLHALPKTIPQLEMIESIVGGVILLSIFVYGLGLLFFMLNSENKNKIVNSVQ